MRSNQYIACLNKNFYNLINKNKTDPTSPIIRLCRTGGNKRMAKKKAKVGYSPTQMGIFLLMLLGSVGLLTLNMYYPDAYSSYYMVSGVGLFLLAALYFFMIRKK